MSAVHIPHCPHCHSEIAARPAWFEWWFGQDCKACGKRFEICARRDGLYGVRAAAVNGKNIVQCPYCRFAPIGPRWYELLPTIPRDSYATVTCAGCGHHFEAKRIADQLFDSRPGGRWQEAL